MPVVPQSSDASRAAMLLCTSDQALLTKGRLLGITTPAALILLVLAVYGLNAWSQGTSAAEDKAPSWRFLPPATTASATVDTRKPAEISFEDKYFELGICLTQTTTRCSGIR